MSGRGQSDRPIVPQTPPNNGVVVATPAEAAEERGLAKGNWCVAARPGHSAGTACAIGVRPWKLGFWPAPPRTWLRFGALWQASLTGATDTD